MAQINFYLDKRVTNKQRTSMMKLSIAHRGRTVYQSLSLYLEPRQWNERKGVVTNHPQKAYLNTLMGETLLKWRRALLEAEMSAARLQEMSAQELKEFLINCPRPRPRAVNRH